MTRDNDDRVDTSTGDPGPNLEPQDVIKCRECGGMVRRVNSQHLKTDRCRYVDPQEVRRNRDEKDWNLRPDHPESVEEYKEKYPDAPVISPAEREKLAKANRDEEVEERRKEQLRRRWRGEEPGDVLDKLADKYDISKAAIRHDWKTRSDWIGRAFGLEDAQAVVLESMAQKKDVRRRLLRVARRAEDENDIMEAVRALKAVDSNIDSLIDHQKDLVEGVKAKTEHTVEVSGQVEHNHTSPGDGLDTETLEQLDEVTGGEDEEIIDAEYEVKEDDGEGQADA